MQQVRILIPLALVGIVIFFVVIVLALSIAELIDQYSTPTLTAVATISVTPLTTFEPTSTFATFTPIPFGTTPSTPELTATEGPKPTITASPSVSPTDTPTIIPSITPTLSPTATATFAFYTYTPTPTRWYNEPPEDCHDTYNEVPCMYTVRDGDVYASIAEIFYDDQALYDEIRHLNRAWDGTYQSLAPGVRLYMPDFDEIEGPGPIQVYKSCDDPYIEPPCMYIVRENDTYGIISELFFGTEGYAFRIFGANVDKYLRLGEVIVIPALPEFYR